ncbi:MAG: ferritin family protein [Eubacteriales bacterium]
MDFMQSQTILNLGRSFAGESQARNRYDSYAKQARTEGEEYLARMFEHTSANEKIHAQEYWEMMVKLAGKPINNLKFEAGYPYQIGNTAQNLQFAADAEIDEYANVYPAFAQIAKEEGFPEAATLWKMIAQIEGVHHTVFQQAQEEFTQKTLYKKEQPKVWRCINCGHVHQGLEPWKICPVCHKEQGWVMGYVNTKVMPSN